MLIMGSKTGGILMKVLFGRRETTEVLFLRGLFGDYLAGRETTLLDVLFPQGLFGGLKAESNHEFRLWWHIRS